MSASNGTTGGAEKQQLKADAIGVRGLIVMVIACTAPLTAVASNLPLMLGFGMGIGSVGAIAVVALVLVCFSAGFIAISRRVVNSGAYYAYIAFGLGRRTGAASAMVATLAYNVAAACMAVLVGYFADTFLTKYTNLDIAWWLIAFVAIAVAWLIGAIGVSVTAKVAGWVAITEFVLLLALAVSVFVHHPDRFTVDVFAPSNVFGGNVGLGFVFIWTCFAGYEVAAVYGEEARGSRRTVGIATYASLGLLAVIYVIVTWTLVAAVPDIVRTSADDPGSLITTVASDYLGGWVAPVLLFMITFSFFAATLSFHTMSARYIYSLARDGYFPTALATVSETRRTPVNAGNAQAIICFVVIIPFAIAGSDPLVDFLPAVSGMNTLGGIILLTACSASVIVASLKRDLVVSHWTGKIAPTISIIAFLIIAYLVLRDYSAVTGSSSTVVNLMPLAMLVALAYGWFRTSSTRRSSAIDHRAEVDPR